MRVLPLGVRGSTAAPGPDFVRYGGHTSCVALAGENDEGPHLILDAGTGLRTLPSVLGGRPFQGHIVLSHVHWDHVQGLPFCKAIDRPDAQVTLHVPVDDERTDPREVMARFFSPPYFPISPDGLVGEWHFRALVPGKVDIPGADVTVARVAHKGGPTFGVRVGTDGAAMAYLPDHALHEGMSATLRSNAEELVRGADLLLHDGHFRDDEAAAALAYGHSTIGAVLDLADGCEVSRLVLTHHAPERTDDELDALAARWLCTPKGRPVTFARQGMPVTPG